MPPLCDWKGCNLGEGKKAAPRASKSNYCAQHTQLHLKDEKANAKKDQEEKAKKEKEAERQKEMVKMAEAAKKQQEAEKLRQTKIQEIITAANQQVQVVVTQVKQLRSHNPTVSGINAGENAVGNTIGGSENPIKLNLPSNIKPDEVYPNLSHIDDSRSAVCKVRIKDSNGDILVHLR
jgi:hypothetical protein